MKKTRKGYPVYPLTNAQKFHLYYQSFCPKKEVVNIGTSLTIGMEIDIDALREAIYEAYAGCDSMRLRFTKDKEGNWYQYVVDKEEREIEYVDFTGKTMEEANAIMTGWTQIPFEQMDSPMNRVVIIKTPDGFTGTYNLVEHMTMDAQSLVLFMRNIIELYCYKKFSKQRIFYNSLSYFYKLYFKKIFFL